MLSIAAVLTFSHSFAGFAMAMLVVTWPSIQAKAMRVAAAGVVTLIILAANFAAAVSIRSMSTAPVLRDDDVSLRRRRWPRRDRRRRRRVPDDELPAIEAGRVGRVCRQTGDEVSVSINFIPPPSRPIALDA